jgi:hypothetical protein
MSLYEFTNKNAPAVVRARSEHTTTEFMCGCNSNCQQTSNETCDNYTREAALWATSLPKIEGE